MKRKTRALLAKQTLTIAETGTYTVASGSMSLGPDILEAVRNTVEYEAGACPALLGPGAYATAISVTEETTLAACRRLADQEVCALNFASAKNPGGGFLGGSQAQEESLARSSALYACLNGRRMYTHHRYGRDAMYTDWAIYSPRVPVWMDDDGELLDPWYPVSFITSPAPNAGVVLRRKPRRRAELVEAFAARIRKVLAIAAHHGHGTLVLGAWGCGVFRNDPAVVAGLFADALHGEFSGVFEEVVFAVFDTSKDERFRGPFAARL